MTAQDLILICTDRADDDSDKQAVLLNLFRKGFQLGPGVRAKADIRCEKGYQLVQREVAELGGSNWCLFTENPLVGFIAGL